MRWNKSSWYGFSQGGIMRRLALLKGKENRAQNAGSGFSAGILFMLALPALAYPVANMFGPLARYTALALAAVVALSMVLSSLPWTRIRLLLLIEGLLLTATAATISSNVANLNGIRFAAAFEGSDLGAKINGADADLGNEKGEIWIMSPGTISTPVRMRGGHSLRISGGYSTVNATITLAGSNTLLGTNMNSTGLRCGSALANMVAAANPADRIVIHDIALDGNSLCTNVVNLTRSEGPSN